MSQTGTVDLTALLREKITKWRRQAEVQRKGRPHKVSKLEMLMSAIVYEVCADELEAALVGRPEPPTCKTCVHLTPFELHDDLFTCPVVNIRIHKESADVFGCNQHDPRD